MVEKREPPFGLDMPFSEALQRFAATRPDEVKKSDEAGKLIVHPATLKASENKMLPAKSGAHPATPTQAVLDLCIEIQRDVNGVEMGVLENGIPFLTQRGLAKITGAPRSSIYDLTQEWEVRFDDDILKKDRFSFLREYLAKNSYTERKLYIETKKDGSTHFAYPDIVCMAIIEFYAFEAKTPNKEAIENYRRLAAYGLQKFIYDALHYTPTDKWQHHHDRVSILQNAAPDGYWIVFNEITGLIVDLITAGLTVNTKTIPDISVGQAWALAWEAEGHESRFGPRIRCAHNYPSYFPQAASNPQPAWAYPDQSLAEFRKWFRHENLVTKFPRYILTKAKLLAGGKDEALAIGGLYQPKAIEG